MEFPKNFKYTKDHEWVRIDKGLALVGITEFAQSELGELVFVELPAIGKSISQGDTLCVVESTKAASDVYAPVSGKVVAVNTELANNPSRVNESPYEQGWLVKLDSLKESELSKLMDDEQYRKLVEAAH